MHDSDLTGSEPVVSCPDWVQVNPVVLRYWDLKMEFQALGYLAAIA